MHDEKKARLLQERARQLQEDVIAGHPRPASSYDESDTDRCASIVAELCRSMQVKVEPQRDHPEDLAVWVCELAEKINGEMKTRGWVE